MKNIFYKIWNYSPAQIVDILKNKIFVPEVANSFNISDSEFKRLKSLPRYQETETDFMGKKLYVVDAHSYLSMLNEIFDKNNYKFISEVEDPLIIDCGSNIGLSVIFFKALYPKSRIIAFEPDKEVFCALEKNIKSFNLTGIDLHNQAVWSRDGKINFLAEGSWGGKIVENKNDDDDGYLVDSIRLKNYLNEKISLLKIDIEGAEDIVLADCAENLKNVENLFVEYHSSPEKTQNLQEILSMLTTAGMRYHIKEAAVKKEPYLNKTSSGFDSQLDIFAFR